MYKCKVINNRIIKNKRGVEVVDNLPNNTKRGASATTTETRRQRRRSNLETRKFSGSFWQRHNQNQIPTHKTHHLTIITRPYRYIVVV